VLLRRQDRSLDQNLVLSNMEPQEIPIGSELCIAIVQVYRTVQELSIFYPFLLLATVYVPSGIVSYTYRYRYCNW
jgi:hypothetical protein